MDFKLFVAGPSSANELSTSTTSCPPGGATSPLPSDQSSSSIIQHSTTTNSGGDSSNQSSSSTLSSTDLSSPSTIEQTDLRTATSEFATASSLGRLGGAAGPEVPILQPTATVLVHAFGALQTSGKNYNTELGSKSRGKTKLSGSDPFEPSRKRKRYSTEMHDQANNESLSAPLSVTTSHNQSSGSTGGRREGVAARLKKCLPPQSNNASNGNSSVAACINIQGASCSVEGVDGVGQCVCRACGQPMLDGLAAPNIMVHQATSAHVSPAQQVELSDSDKQLVRLIGQHLKQSGLKETVAKLIQESGCQLENAAAVQFRVHLLAGEWDLVLTDLRRLQSYVPKADDLLHMQFLILEQKYVELLESGQMLDALNVLRYELQQLQHRQDRIHQLSAMLMAATPNDVRLAAGWPPGGQQEARQALLEKIQTFIPPEQMLPPRRLQTLLEQAVRWQHAQCPLQHTHSRVHDGLQQSHDTKAMLTDHRCVHMLSRSTFPCETRQLVTDNSDEVWCVFFSHDGKRLAAGGKEPIIFVYDFEPTTRKLIKFAQLPAPKSGCAFLSWSHDDTMLAAVGQDGPDMWIYNVQERRVHKRVLQNNDDHLSALSWHVDNTRLVAGGIKGHFIQCDTDGQVLDSWEGIRVRALWCKRDGNTVLAADSHHRVRAYDFDAMTDRTLITEDDNLMYFCLDRAEKHALCTTKSRGLHLWDLESRQMVRSFFGSRHDDFVVVSCFGGDGDQFVASGSEDGRVYIWHIDGEKPVHVLHGHTGSVNAVTWNPVDPCILVSCGDDGTLRVWGPPNGTPTMLGSAGIFGHGAVQTQGTSGMSSGSDNSLSC